MVRNFFKKNICITFPLLFPPSCPSQEPSLQLFPCLPHSFKLIASSLMIIIAMYLCLHCYEYIVMHACMYVYICMCRYINTTCLCCSCVYAFRAAFSLSAGGSSLEETNLPSPGGLPLRVVPCSGKRPVRFRYFCVSLIIDMTLFRYC